MPLTHTQKHQLLLSLYQSRDSTDLRNVVEYCKLEQQDALRGMTRAAGHDDLLRFQAAYNGWDKIIAAITKPPLTPPEQSKREVA